MNARDLKTIYIAHYIGKNLDTHKSEYTEPFKVRAVITNDSTVVQDEDIARIKDYDIEIRTTYGNKVKYTDENSILWVNTTPNADNSNSDYLINRKPEILRNGDIVLYCKSNVVNTVAIYYSNDNNIIYGFNMDYDRENKIAKVSRNTYLPFTENSLIWIYKPIDVNTTRGKMNIKEIKTNNSSTLVFLEESGD